MNIKVGKMDYKFLFTILVTVGGWCMTLGMYVTKIKQHDKEIEDIKKQQNTNETLLNAINTQLVELNTKVTLLLRGKINVEGGKND